jgi:hypothetical protein
MLGPQFESEEVDPILTQIYEGMPVHDRAGRMVGTVEYVYLGEVAEAPEYCGHHERTSSFLRSTEGSLIEEFANAILLTEQLSDIWRERLLSFGFIKINRAGLFTAYRYAMPSQIAGVVDNRVLLCADRDELLEG